MSQCPIAEPQHQYAGCRDGRTKLVRNSDEFPQTLPADVEQAAQAFIVIWGRSAERVRPTVSASQLRALLVAESYESITLTGLAEELRSTPSVTSRLCDRLQAAGLLVREAGTDDRREITLQLSRDGRRLLRKFRKDRQADLEEVLRIMKPRSRAALLAGLDAFHAAATELGLPDEELA